MHPGPDPWVSSVVLKLREVVRTTQRRSKQILGSQSGDSGSGGLGGPRGRLRNQFSLTRKLLVQG